MPYIRFYYHIVWATENRDPVLTDEDAAVAIRSFELTIADFDAIPFASAVLTDHAHIALSILPRHAVSDVVQRLKGASSHAINDARGGRRGRFAWQADYGAITFGDRSLERVVSYIRNQRAHHAEGSLWPVLEQSDDGHLAKKSRET